MESLRPRAPVTRGPRLLLVARRHVLMPRAPSSASMTRGRAAATGGRSRTPRSVYLSVSHSVPLLLLGPAFPFSPVETFSLYKVLFSSSFLWTGAVGRHFRSRA